MKRKKRREEQLLAITQAVNELLELMCECQDLSYLEVLGLCDVLFTKLRNGASQFPITELIKEE